MGRVGDFGFEDVDQNTAFASSVFFRAPGVCQIESLVGGQVNEFDTG